MKQVKPMELTKKTFWKGGHSVCLQAVARQASLPGGPQGRRG